MHDFHAELFQQLVGRTIIKVEQAPVSDEGLLITFDNGDQLLFRFSGCYGDIEVKSCQVA